MADHIPYSHLEKGSFLVASPELEEGLFHRCVILLCEHAAAGSFGLIINKPLEMQLPEDLAHIDDLSNPNIQMRAGGPLQPNQIMILHSGKEEEKQAAEILPGAYLGGDIQFLQEAINDPEGPQIRICFGFSGWSAGELEREFLKGAWFLHPANPEHIFHTPHDKVWQTVLRDMGGKYATLSMIPEDLSLN